MQYNHIYGPIPKLWQILIWAKFDLAFLQIAIVTHKANILT